MAPGTRASSSNSHSRPLASSVRAKERTYGEAEKSHRHTELWERSQCPVPTHTLPSCCTRAHLHAHTAHT